MLRNMGMIVKAVDADEILRHLRCLYRQVCGASAAEDKHVNFVLPVTDLADIYHRNARGKDLHSSRISSGKYCRQLHILISGHGAFNTPS